MVFGAISAARADEASEYQVKAAFVYNFAKFIEWPASAFQSSDSPIVLCVSGTTDAYSKAFSAIDGKTAQGRAIRIRREPGIQDLASCQILYLASEDQGRVKASLHAVRAASVLTISGIDGFADAGGVIGLVVADSRVQFEINKAAGDRAGLKISSHVLKLARAVRDVDPRGRS